MEAEPERIWQARQTQAQAALRLGIDHPETLNVAAHVLYLRGHTRSAEQALRTAIIRYPKSARLWQSLGWMLMDLDDLAGALACAARAVDLSPDDMSVWPSYIFLTDHYPHATPRRKLAVRRQFNDRFSPRYPAPQHRNVPDPERPLRVGYLSADFRRHSAPMVFAPLLMAFNAKDVTVYAYDLHPGEPDVMTLGLTERTVWRRVHHELSDAALVDLIRADGIDILVDLQGWSSGCRPGVLLAKPAPIIVTGWGYATGTGLDAVDYFMADHMMIGNPADHAEQIVHLPSGVAYWHERMQPYPEISAPPDAPVTFGYFGRSLKITDHMLALWAEILHLVEGSRLLLKTDVTDPAQRDRLCDVLAASGIVRSRVEIVGQCVAGAHLATYNRVHVNLDTSPVGGGVGILDACLMGVPTVTLLGQHVVGRLGGSILSTLGDPDSVCGNDAAYVATAARWALHPAGAPERLLRRSWFLDSIICNRYAYAATVEDEYRKMWRRWCYDRLSEVS